MFKRELGPLFDQYLRSFSAVVLTGARQVGKTTFLRERLGQTHQYVLMEDPDIRRLAAEDPRAFLARYPAPLLIDEFQEVPELLSYLQGIIDEHRGMKGQYVLTGSQNFLMMERISQSLAGRVGILELFGLSTGELGLQGLSREQLLLRIFRGSYPELSREPELDARAWQASYFKTYVERDIRSLTQVGDLASFERFARVLAVRTGTVLNLSEAARDSGISPSTAERWLSLLEQTYIVFKLEPYHANISSRIRKAPKIFFYDTGLASYLAGYRRIDALESSPHLGAFFETWVIADLKKRLTHLGLETPLFFMDVPRYGEADIVWEQGGDLHMAEIKLNQTPRPEQAVSLRKLRERLGAHGGKSFVVGSFAQSMTMKEVEFLPWTQFFDIVDANS